MHIGLLIQASLVWEELNSIADGWINRQREQLNGNT